jgi:hypothetical protein
VQQPRLFGLVCDRLNLHTKYFILSYHSRCKTTTVSSEYFPELNSSLQNDKMVEDLRPNDF